MKRLLSIFTVIFGCALQGWATAPEPLTTLRTVAALGNAEAQQHPGVRFEGTVLFFYRPGASLYVQDGDAAIAVKNAKDISMAPGDRVLVEGTAQPSLLSYVLATEITVLRHGKLPAALPASFDDLMRAPIDSRLVRVRGTIRTGEVTTLSKTPQGRLQLLMDGGYVDVEVQSQDREAIKRLLDAEVEVTGVAAKKYDGKMQQTGAKVKISSLADIRILKRSTADLWSLPLTPLGRIIAGYHVRDLNQRLHVHGTITYYQPGAAVVLQSDNESLWVSILSEDPLRIGDAADVTGFPEFRDGRLILAHAEIRDSGAQAPIVAQPTSADQLAFWGKNRLGGHENDLVATEGRVVYAVREAAQDEYILASHGRVFSAIYAHPSVSSEVPPMLQVPAGSEIRVKGICIVTRNSSANQEVPFSILLRSFADIEVVARPSPLSVRNLVIVIGLLLLAIIAVSVRGWALARKVRRQTAAAAHLERRRGRILEEINRSSPLAEIMEHITEIVASSLGGAFCWCQIADGARLGKRPPILDGLHIVESEIASRSGSSLGQLCAAFAPGKALNEEEREALSMGVSLAALAIETRRLYSDLVHRSEFDLLTEVKNRFSLEKHLHTLIHAARETAGVFGLIYIDLDRFKQVNDAYGHQFGDKYLQQVALRLKAQLRPGDLLARLGGDEFGVLVPVACQRTGVQEIALRLEHCFDEPFMVEQHGVHGSASFGVALYPEDATTTDGLLSAADAAMYAVKHAKNAATKMPVHA